jgi:hypothetical protein
MSKPTLEEFQDACNHIIQAGNDPKQVNQVNWAVNYAKHGLLIHDEEAMYAQALYILNNISRWRGETAKQVRALMKRC